MSEISPIAKPVTIQEAIKLLWNEYKRINTDGNARLMVAMGMAIKALEDSRWIPVTERLPEESYDSVIGWDAYRERCVFVQFYNGHFQISGSNETFDIKYWMPMITPPMTEVATKLQVSCKEGSEEK